MTFSEPGPKDYSAEEKENYLKFVEDVVSLFTVL